MAYKLLWFPITSFLLFICLIGFPQSGLAQQVSGTVLDKATEIPLENVNIYIENTKIGTATNDKGKFRLRINAPTSQSDSLTFSIVGYRTLKLALSDLLDTNPNTIMLSELTNELGEVIVDGKRKLQQKLRYKELSRLKRGLFAFGSTLIDDKIYVIGGSESYTEDTMREAIEAASINNPTGGILAVLDELDPNGSYQGYNNELQVYDILSDQWHTSPIEFENRSHHQLNIINDKIYALGGKRVANNKSKEYLLNTIEILRLDSLQIIMDNVNPHQAVDFASFTYNDNLLVMGGSNKMTKDGRKVFTDKCHFFNATNGYWYELATMTKPKETDGAIIEDKVYLIGGFNGEPLSEIESLDLETGTWKKEGDLFYAMEKPSITKHNGTIYIYNFGKLHIYDTKKATLTAYDIDLFINNPNLHYYQNKLYVLGGLVEEEFSKKPSSRLYEINLNQLAKTKVADSKNL